MRMATFLVTLAGSWPTHSDAQRIESYSGSCDASAGISLSRDIFVVGNDENNTLHFYRRGEPAPIGTLPLSTFLGARSNEADIEGAAQIGSRIYWISSHSRSSNGKRQPSRHRIFATEIRGESSPRLEPVGKPYVDLLRDLTDTEALKPYQLGAAARLAGGGPGRTQHRRTRRHVRRWPADRLSQSASRRARADCAAAQSRRNHRR
jgi:hypothetical protein